MIVNTLKLRLKASTITKQSHLKLLGRKMRTTFDTIAIVTNTGNGRGVEVEVDNVREKDSLNAFIANTKIHMKWNGKIYVGNMAGMEFTTPGPKQHMTKQGRY